MRKILKKITAVVLMTYVTVFACCCAPIALRDSENSIFDVEMTDIDGNKTDLPVKMDFRNFDKIPGTAVIEVGRLSEDMGISVAVAMDLYRQLGSKRITLLINSPGGNVAIGHALADYIENFELPVTCIVTGDAKSMALYVLQGCDWRVAVPDAEISGHEPATVIVQQLWNRYDMLQRAMALEQISSMMAIYITRRSNITPEIYMDNLLTTGMWDLTAKQAYDLGLLDEIINKAEVPKISTIITPNVGNNEEPVNQKQ